MMKKSLIIGGNGFIGSHLADKLVEMGREVTVFDRFSHGIRNFISPDIRTHAGDFLNVDDLRSAVAGKDEVFHFLSVTTPATAYNDPLLDIRVNTAQSVALFDACVRANVPDVYFASSGGAVYGETPHATLREENQTNPKSPYAISKLSLEHYLEYFRVTKGLNYRIFRISNPYGPRQNPVKPQGLIPIVLRRILSGQSVVQFGDGSMVRDYLYVEDLVDMISSSLEVKGNYQTYNLGSGIGTSVSEIFGIIRQITGIEFPIEYREMPPTYVHRAVLDMTRFQDDFATKTKISLNQGIHKTWESIQIPN
ncbi:NAD-dependent epimerase/dehydratase family protein [Arthrobacter sp. TWP1-1]|uniref:NAD-dependent epimerase/dehydratase family protein n=1 Tax=Arthrobacter sp. TWP1-1 TaxID=2804568 RepID=UPI003CF98C3F